MITTIMIITENNSNNNIFNKFSTLNTKQLFVYIILYTGYFIIFLQILIFLNIRILETGIYCTLHTLYHIITCQ